jgi:hypothetical protein
MHGWLASTVLLNDHQPAGATSVAYVMLPSPSLQRAFARYSVRCHSATTNFIYLDTWSCDVTIDPHCAYVRLFNLYFTPTTLLTTLVTIIPGTRTRTLLD